MVETLSLPVVDYLIEQQLAEQAATPTTQNKGQPVSELISYLGKLGLEDTHVSKVISLLKATHGDGPEQRTAPADSQKNISQQKQY